MARTAAPKDIAASEEQHVHVAAADERRLRAAGFMPVTRWVDVFGRSDKALKTIEALTLLDRREDAAKKGDGL